MAHGIPGNRGRVKGGAMSAGALCVWVATAAAGIDAPQSAGAAALQTSDSVDMISQLAPGDAIRITVPADTGAFLNDTYPIDQNWRIFLPLLGPTPVRGRSTKKVTALLDSVFIPYLRFPGIRVEPLIRASFTGGFQRPGLYYVNPELSLWDALAQTGGPVREDGFAKLRWERNGTIVSEDLIPLIQSGRSLRQIGFRSGDRIAVTAKPLRTGWEVFREDVLPIISISVAALASATSIIILVRED